MAAEGTGKAKWRKGESNFGILPLLGSDGYPEVQRQSCLLRPGRAVRSYITYITYRSHPLPKGCQLGRIHLIHGYCHLHAVHCHTILSHE
jgi:hypothetical protein